MITFFTDPYDDELLYSMMSRYHYYCGNLNYKDTLMELLGSRSAIPTFEFPRRLDYFSKQFTNGKYTSDYFIQKHSLLPLYKPFIPDIAYREIEREMKFGDGKRIYARIGYSAGSICFKKGLYYCPLCVLNDMEYYGESYFRRLHQTQGVICCLKHECLLRPYHVTKKDISRLGSIIIRKEKVNLIPEYENDHVFINQLLEVAGAAKSILSGDLNDFYQHKIWKAYRRMLSNKGFMTCNNFVKQNKLHESFNAYWDTKILETLESNIEYSFESNWLKAIIRKPKKVVHPIRNVLLILFLCGSVNEFLKANKLNIKPFGNGPWPCLNPAADHYKVDVITKCIITPDYKSRKPVGTFKCSCGFIYSRKGPDLSKDDKYRIGKIKQFGDVWQTKLMKCIYEDKLELRKLARVMR